MASMRNLGGCEMEAWTSRDCQPPSGSYLLGLCDWPGCQKASSARTLLRRRMRAVLSLTENMTSVSSRTLYRNKTESFKGDTSEMTC